MSESGGTFRAELSTAGGALSSALRKAVGRANDASTIPPMDAIIWRRLTSMVKSVLLHAAGSTYAGADFTGHRLRESKFIGTARGISPNSDRSRHFHSGRYQARTGSPAERTGLPGGLVEGPGVGDDVPQRRARRLPAQLTAGLVAGGGDGGGVTGAARGPLGPGR